MKTKIALFVILLIIIVSYILWMFYMSEPQYIDNPRKGTKIEKYDIVSIRPYNNTENSLKIGMVLQIDSTSFKNNDYAVIKSLQYRDTFNDILINTKTPAFKIIGTGTFYHKINYFIGFNLMLLTTFIVMIIGIIVFVTLIRLLLDFFS